MLPVISGPAFSAVHQAGQQSGGPERKMLMGISVLSYMTENVLDPAEKLLRNNRLMNSFLGFVIEGNISCV